VTDDDGTRVRVIIGDFWGRTGPVEGVAADPRYLDVSVPPRRTKRLAVDRANNAFAYVFAGSGTFRDASDPQAVTTEVVPSAPLDTGASSEGLIDKVSNRSLVLFDRGDEIVVQAGEQGIRFLLVSGKPLEEPVAWRGPIVMNTSQELQQAYAELRAGTFIK
jgi:redox-sensitive bicupin YhaK (pirin superfamily)